MSVESVTIAITAQSKGVDQQLKKTQKKFDNLNKKIMNDTATKNISQMKNALGGMGKMGDTLGGTLSKIAGGFTSLLSPIGLATAAIGGLIAFSVDMYKKLTLSHEEYIEYLNHSLQNSKNKFSNIENQEKTDNGYFERLKQLNSVQQVSNAIKTETIMIIQLLTRRYGDLGLSIDETTGKIIGLDGAFDQFQRRIAKMKLSELNLQADIANRIAQQTGKMASKYGVKQAFQKDTYQFFETPQETKKRRFGTDKEAQQIMRIVRQRQNNYLEQNISTDTIQQITAVRQRIANLANKGKNEGYTSTELGQLKELRQKENSLEKLIELQKTLVMVELYVKKTASDPSTNKQWVTYAESIRKAINIQKQANVQMGKQQNGQIGRRERALALANQQMKLGIKIKDAERQTESYEKQQKEMEQQYFYSRKDKADKITFINDKLQKNKKERNFIYGTSEGQSWADSSIVNSEYRLQMEKLLQKERDKKLSDDEKKTLAIYKTMFGNRISAYKQQKKNYQKLLAKLQSETEKYESEFGTKKQNWTAEQHSIFNNATSGIQQQIEKSATRLNLGSLTDTQLKARQQELQKKQEAGPLTASEFDELLQINKKLVNLEAQKAQAAKLLQKNRKDELELLIKQRQITDELKDTFKHGNEQLDRQLQLQKQILTGDLKAIQRQKVLNALKAKGYDPEKLKKQGIDIDKDVNAYVDKKMDLERQKYMNAENQSIERQLKLQQLKAQGKLQQIERQKIILALKEKNAKIDQKEVDALVKKKMELASKQYMNEQNKNIDKQIQMQKLILQGKFDQIEKLKIINELKAKGAKIDAQQIDNLMKKKKELAALQLQSDLKSSAEGLLYQVESRIDKKQAQYNKRIRDYEKKYGALTDQQKGKVKQIIDLEFKLDKLNDVKAIFSNAQIQTNDLTRRGGFQTGYTLPDKQAVNKEIKTINEKQAALLKQIKDILNNGWKI